MKKFALVMLLGLMSVSLAFGEDPAAVVNHALYTIDAVTPGTTITAQGDGSSAPLYGVPASSSSVGWVDTAQGAQTYDFSDGVAASGVYALPYDLWVEGTVDIDFNSAGSGNIWVGLGLMDAHHFDGYAVGQDPKITYGSGSYGFGWPGGITIVGPNSTDGSATSLKLEDGWSTGNDGSEATLSSVNFDFMLRYGFTDGDTITTRSIRAWFKPAGDPPANWVEWASPATGLGDTPSGSDERPERYQNDQWDQVLVGALCTMDDAGATGSVDIANMSMKIDALGGDFDLDGDVDVTDLGILATTYGTSGQNWLTGDTDNDGDVDVTDLGVLATYYGQSVAAAAVPEPSTLVLLFSAIGLLLFRRR